MVFAFPRRLQGAKWAHLRTGVPVGNPERCLFTGSGDIGPGAVCR